MSAQSPESRHAIDPIFKQVLTEEIAPLASLQTEVEVSRLPRTIDALVTLNTDEEVLRVRTKTPFFHFLRYNQVEFKGREDPLTIAGCHLISGRTQLYLGEHGMAQEEMTVTIICAGKPRTVLTYVQTFQPFHQLEDGYYRNDAYPPVYLIVINELPITPKNYSLLLFASSDRKFRQFLEQLITEGNMRYIRYAYELRPEFTREVLRMAGIATSISRKDLEFMAKDIGPELIPFLKPEDVLKGLNAEKKRRLFQQLLASMNVEEWLSDITLEELIGDLKPEQRKKLLTLVLKMLASGLADNEEAK
ncbi:MAG: hypothetical protein U0350_02940 [Caldilineaceae bacterium]